MEQRMRGVIFDMDGTMFDTQAIYDEEWVHCAAEYGREATKAFLDEIRGSGGPVMREILHSHFPGIDPEEIKGRCEERVLLREETEVPMKPGLLPLLEALEQQGMRIAVASSSIRRMVAHNLAFTGTDRYFDAVIAGDQVTRAKPDPEIFLTAARMLGIAPQECWVIEDSPNGIEAAHRAGCRPILVPDRAVPTEAIKSLCTGVYRDLTEVQRAVFS